MSGAYPIDLPLRAGGGVTQRATVGRKGHALRGFVGRFAVSRAFLPQGEGGLPRLVRLPERLAP
jgi:hypothetical protein